MNAIVTDEMMQQAIQAVGLPLEGVQPGPAALASPSYMALESRSAFAGGAFVKRMHPEMRAWFDPQTAMQAAVAAGEAGVGPRVLWQDAETGTIAMDALGQGWATARQHHLQDPATLAAIMSAMTRLHGMAPLGSRFDPFKRIEAVIEAHGEAGVALPDDILWLRRVVARIEKVMDGAKLVPCRNDGSSSNIMIGPEGRIMLVDYDRAGMNDPLYDIGCLLAELTDLESDMKAGFTAYWGAFDRHAFARARLWSHVDDMLHALWARLMAYRSERGAVEWLKYGEWRLLRLRMTLQDPTFEEKLRLTVEAPS